MKDRGLPEIMSDGERASFGGIASTGQTDELHRLVLENSHDLFSLVDLEGQIRYASPSWQTVLGYAPDDLLGTNGLDLVHPDDLADAQALMAEASDAGRVFSSHVRLRHCEGGWVDFDGTGSLIHDDEGQPVLLVSIRDITERLRAESERSRLGAIVESSDDAIIGKTLEGIITSWNSGAERLYGFTAKEAIGASVSLIVPPERRHEVDEFTKRIARGDSVDHHETKRVRKGGEIIDVSVTISPIRDAAGRIVGASSVGRDIRERQAAERVRRINAELETSVDDRTSELAAINRELVESEARKSAIVESAIDCMITIDHDGNIIEFNSASERTFGYARDEVMGKPIADVIIPPSLREQHRRGMAHYMETGEGPVLGKRVELTAMRSDGSEFPVELSINRVDVPGLPMFTGFIRDISDRKRAETEILRLNRDLERRVEERTAELESAVKELEAFSYSVSHDLRAPLRAINGFSRIVLRDYAPQLDGQAQDYLRSVRDGAQKMGQLIDDLLTFARLGRQSLVREPVDVERIVADCLEQLDDARDGRRLQITVGDLPPCQGDSAMLRQVFFNLLENAIKFTGRRPVAHIEVGCRADERPPVYFVRDDGAGFDMEYADKLFGVFQRLHQADEFDGTGVGLAIVQRIVQRHGGRVWAEAGVDKGATFSLTLEGEPADD